jgi:rubrerythrin
MYRSFAEIAREEGFNDIADLFERVATVEAHHEERYLKLVANLENEIVFKRGEKVFWICRNCGYIYEGSEAPQVCPLCAHPRSYFQILNEDF